MRRTIWPVGHGAFYTEVFNGVDSPFSVVYDCGAVTVDLITKKIDNFLATIPHDDKTKPIVDMVFISHFHKDHINGLGYLFEKADVKNVIIPQIERNALLEAYLYNAITNVKNTKADISSDAQNIIFDLVTSEKLADYETNLVQIYPYNESYQDTTQSNNLEYDIERKTVLHRNIRTGQIVSAMLWNDLCWEYIPINVYKDVEGKVDDLINKLRNIDFDGQPLVQGNGVDLQRIKEYLTNHGAANIRDAYRKVFGQNDNIYSMPLYSGPRCYLYHWWQALRADSDNLHIHLNRYLDSVSKVDAIQHLIQKSITCLYMGDFVPFRKIVGDKTALDILKELLKHRWCRIGLQQIPHHASSDNHTIDLYDRPKLCFANVDNHSDISFSQNVIRDIIDRKAVPFVVTELDEPIDFYYDI